jgi:hypothetical protein
MELGQFASEVRAHFPARSPVCRPGACRKDLVPALGDENQMNVQGFEKILLASADVIKSGHVPR